MDSPRLKFNGKEFGLRRVHDDVYELKNANIFQKYFDSEFIPEKHGYFFYENLCRAEKPERFHKIESFCFVTTKNIMSEAAILLKSLRKFHDEPVYIICDKVSKRYLGNLNLIDDNVFFRLVAEKDDLKNIDKDIFAGHKCIANEIHNAPAIFKKMEVMEFALDHHNNTFFLDSDIIVLDSLQEYFESKVVLSPHYYPKRTIMNGYENGFYNAGYIFCASKGFPNYWRHIYLNDSIFFEQECMNRIPDTCQIQTFSKEHNVGFWREGILPEHIKSLHFHISDGVNKKRTNHLQKLNDRIKSIGMDYMKRHHRDLYNYCLQMMCPKKVAFVHIGKTAGVYINQYLKTTCLKPYVKFFSWHENLNPYKIKDRDWTKEELFDIAKNADDYSFLTQHHINWDTEIMEEFKKNGWFVFTFLRRPEELLCSLYNWSKDNNIPLRDNKHEPQSLEELFNMSIYLVNYFWVIHNPN